MRIRTAAASRVEHLWCRYERLGRVEASCDFVRRNSPSDHIRARERHIGRTELLKMLAVRVFTNAKGPTWKLTTLHR